MRIYILVLAIMAVALAGCAKKADWQQKLVLYFDTPNGPMTASSVIRVDFTGAMEWAGDLDHDHTDLTGEAVVADLGGRFLFALIEEGAGRMIVRVLPPDKKRAVIQKFYSLDQKTDRTLGCTETAMAANGHLRRL